MKLSRKAYGKLTPKIRRKIRATSEDRDVQEVRLIVRNSEAMDRGGGYTQQLGFLSQHL